MRIGFDAKRAFLNRTGLGNYSRSTINALYRLSPENEYFLYTPSRGKDPFYTPPGKSVVRMPQNFLSKRLSGYWRIAGINQDLSNDNIQLFHGLSNELPIGIHNAGIKSVVTIHDLIFLGRPELYKPIDRMIYKRKVSAAVNNADRVIAISTQTRDDLVEMLGADEKKIRIVFQGCNPWFYHKTDGDMDKVTRKKYNLPPEYLLYLGTIEERKNLLTIVQALHEGKINIPLVAVGRATPYFQKVLRYIQKHNVQNIHFHHHIDNADLPSLYQQSLAFIYPSSYEGFGIPVLEAINSSVPVITSRGGCLEETAGAGALLVEPGNVEELIYAIQQILDDRKLRDELVKAGKAHALKFREENTIPELLNVYKECMQ